MRHLQDITDRPTGLVAREELEGLEGLIEANYFVVQLDFTLPDYVSRST